MKIKISLLVKIFLGCAILLLNVPNVKAEEVQSFEVDKYKAGNVEKNSLNPKWKSSNFKIETMN